MAEEMVKACPNCGSLDVHVSRENVVDMMGMDHEYTCHNCGFTSKLFPEVPEDNVEEYEDAFQDEFGDRYLNRDWGFSVSGSNHGRIIVGALLVLFGASGLWFPGRVSPLLYGALVILAGIALIVFEVRH